MITEVKKVHFLCTGNSARSQNAEGLLSPLGSGKRIRDEINRKIEDLLKDAS
jgi:protein-tyrosine-phosphatase